MQVQRWLFSPGKVNSSRPSGLAFLSLIPVMTSSVRSLNFDVHSGVMKRSSAVSSRRAALYLLYGVSGIVLFHVLGSGAVLASSGVAIAFVLGVLASCD